MSSPKIDVEALRSSNFNPYEVLQEPDKNDPDCVGIKILEYTPENQELTERFPNDFKEIIHKHDRATNIIISGCSKNLRGQLEQIARNIPGGPWSLDGRDGTLNIHNQKKLRPITKVYTYAGGNGELLRFQVKSKFVKSSVEISKAADIDPDTKDLDVTTAQTLVDINGDNVDGFIHWSGRQWLDTSPDFGNNLDPNAGDPRTRLSNRPLYDEYAIWDPQVLENTRKRQEVSRQEIQRAKEEYDSLPEFSSISDAQKAISADPQLTSEEVNAFMEQLRGRFESLKDPQTYSTLDKAIHDTNVLGNFTIERKIKLRETIDPTRYDPNPPNSLSNAGMGRAYIHPSQVYAERQSSWDRGYNHLKKQGNIEIISRNQSGLKTDYGTPIGCYDTITIVREATVTVPINGARVLSSDVTPNSGVSMGNDIEEVVKNQVTATALVVGDPSIESSMNIQIQNVSSKYSGSWYTKKVTHKFNSGSGYTCDIEFIQRDIPVSKNVIKANLVVQKAMADINGIAKESLKTGAYDRIPVLQNTLLEYKEKFPGYSFLAIEEGPGTYAIYKADKDFNVDYIEQGDKIDYSNIVRVDTVTFEKN